MTRLRLVWNDHGAQDRWAVHLACIGQIGELEAYLANRRRRYPLHVVESDRGVRWRESIDAVLCAKSNSGDGSNP